LSPSPPRLGAIFKSAAVMEVTARYCNIVAASHAHGTSRDSLVPARVGLIFFWSFSGPAPVLLLLLRSGGPRVLRAYSVPDVRLQPCSYCSGPSLVPASNAYVDPESYYILPGHLGRDVPVTAFPTTSPRAGGSRSTHGDTAATFLVMRRTLPLEGSRPGAWEE
jgi:hypothetical protein